MLRVLDQNDADIREGMRITFDLIVKMTEVCRRNDIEFVVLVIPTKEMVFAEYLEQKPQLSLSNVIDQLLANERQARKETFEFLVNSNIRFIDALPALRNAVSNELYVRTSTDMHPNKNGYRVLAEATLRDLTRAAPN
jgi:hypothetical protein